MATEPPTEVPTSTSAAQAALLQAALGAPAGRLPVSRLSDVVPRETLRDLVASIRAYREARDDQNRDEGRVAHLLTRVLDQAEAIAWPSTTPPPASTPVLVVLPDAAGLTELLRLAFNAADRDVANRGPGHEPMLPPLAELAADDVDLQMIQAAARHLHPLITSLVFADTATDTAGSGDEADRRPDADDGDVDVFVEQHATGPARPSGPSSPRRTR